MHDCWRDSHATSQTTIYSNITQTGRIRVYCSWFWVVLVGLVGFVGGFGWFWLVLLVVLGLFGWFWLVPCFINHVSSPPENQNLISSAGNVLWCCISLNIVWYVPQAFWFKFVDLLLRSSIIYRVFTIDEYELVKLYFWKSLIDLKRKGDLLSFRQSS